MCNKAVISQHRSGIITRQFEQQMLFHGRGVLSPAALSANHAKVCEAHLAQMVTVSNILPGQTILVLFRRNGYFTFTVSFLLWKTELNRILFSSRWLKTLNYLSLWKSIWQGGKSKTLVRKVTFPSVPQHKAKAKMQAHRNFYVAFFWNLKALYKSIVSAYLCQFHTYHDLADYLYSKAHLSKGPTFLDGLFKGFIALCISKEAYILYM